MKILISSILAIGVSCIFTMSVYAQKPINPNLAWGFPSQNKIVTDSAPSIVEKNEQSNVTEYQKNQNSDIANIVTVIPKGRTTRYERVNLPDMYNDTSFFVRGKGDSVHSFTLPRTSNPKYAEGTQSLNAVVYFHGHGHGHDKKVYLTMIQGNRKLYQNKQQAYYRNNRIHFSTNTGEIIMLVEAEDDVNWSIEYKYLNTQ